MVEFTIKPFLYPKNSEDDLQVYITSNNSKNLYSYFIIGSLQESLKTNEKNWFEIRSFILSEHHPLNCWNCAVFITELLHNTNKRNHSTVGRLRKKLIKT